MCYETGILAMIMLKKSKSARLCRGKFYVADKFKSRHSWVEFKIPLNGWWVLDFAWFHPGICQRKKYFQKISDEGRLTKEWTLSYEEFWNINLVQVLAKKMKQPGTSHIFLELAAFGNPDEGYEFYDKLCASEELNFSDGTWMLPFCKVDWAKPISSGVLRGFVKNPKRQQPKARSYRVAKNWATKIWDKAEEEYIS